MKIYLAGKVPKWDHDIMEDWRTRYRDALGSKEGITYLDPNVPVDEANPLSVFGMDCGFIQSSDLIIVNAEEKLWLGTSQELIIAKYFSKPVIAVLPKDSAHRKSNLTFHGKLVEDWIHPFLFATSDIIVESPEDIDIDTLKDLKIKDITIIDQAIQHFASVS